MTTISATNDDIQLASDFITFKQGSNNLITATDNLEAGIQKIKFKLADLVNIKNLHFLLGAGASADSIPAMKELLERITNTINDAVKDIIAAELSNLSENEMRALYQNASYTNLIKLLSFINFTDMSGIFPNQSLDTEAQNEFCFKTLAKQNLIDLLSQISLENLKDMLIKHLSKNIQDTFEKTQIAHKGNLENILGTLYSKREYQSAYKIKNDIANNLLIKIIEETIFSSINIDLSSTEAEASLRLYQEFYLKLAQRNKDLSRLNIFTTNNDLMSESTLGNLNINYNNGFSSGLSRVFNPARFSYTYSRKIDSNLEKYEPLDNMVYLYKLHGSINWVESNENHFFNIKEIDIAHKDSPSKHNVIIYPTPLKQNKSLGSPYADLIREFHTKLQLQNSVLMIIGYSFSDEHINNAIYSALASNPSLSIVIFGQYDNKPLAQIKDHRIYQIYGEVPINPEDETLKSDTNTTIIQKNPKNIKIHYFQYIVENFLPKKDLDTEKETIRKFISSMEKLKESIEDN